LRKCAGSRGWEVDVRSNKALANSLDQCKDDSDPNVNFLLKSLATYAMVQAEYFSTGSDLVRSFFAFRARNALS
jgi:DIS3-like exonuclease 1